MSPAALPVSSPAPAHPWGGPTAGSDLCPRPRLAAGAQGVTWSGHQRGHRSHQSHWSREQLLRRTEGWTDRRTGGQGEGWVFGVPPGGGDLHP